MSDRPESGTIFGMPYNFERPTIRRLLSSYWQPGKGMLVEKPFGVGYTLNLANPRSWIVVAVASALVWHERTRAEQADGDDEGPIEVLVEDEHEHEHDQDD